MWASALAAVSTDTTASIDRCFTEWSGGDASDTDGAGHSAEWAGATESNALPGAAQFSCRASPYTRLIGFWLG